MAERIAEQVPKGSQVCVQGRLSPATWTNREGKLQTKFRVSQPALTACASSACVSSDTQLLYPCCRSLLMKSGLSSGNHSLLQHSSNSKMAGDSNSSSNRYLMHSLEVYIQLHCNLSKCLPFFWEGISVSLTFLQHAAQSLRMLCRQMTGHSLQHLNISRSLSACLASCPSMCSCKLRIESMPCMSAYCRSA